jgi:AraC-like DNA-binding protein
MSEFDTHPLLLTDTVAIRDVRCEGTCKHKSDEEFVTATHLVFPYRGIYVRHVGRAEATADANQVVFFNEDESYRISHPVDGGDSSLSIAINPATLLELAPAHHLSKGRAAFSRLRLRIDERAQALTALLRHSLTRNAIDTLEGETLTLVLLRRTLNEPTSRLGAKSVGRQKLVDRTKVVLSSDLGRRWTLAAVATEVGVSPVYLTQVFQHIEGRPLYHYQLQLRLARALDLLGNYADLTSLALDLGFSSHSHFSAAFKRAYGQTPSEFQRSARLR